MLKNLLKISLRNMLREKGYTAVNMAGLTAGITCSILLFLYVLDELSYDSYHDNGANIYRVIVHVKEQDDEYLRPLVQIPVATSLGDNFPQVKNATRFFTTGRELFVQEEKRFYEERFYYADSSVFEIFTYDFISGDPATAIKDPFSIVLTKSAAVKYFGSIDVLGRSLTFVDRKENYKVTAIINDVPHNSHFHFDALLSLNSLPFFRTQQNNWGRLVVSTYIELQDDFNPAAFQPMLDSMAAKHVAPLFEKRGLKVDYQLQRITDIHLYSKLEDEQEAGGDISFVYTLVAIAVFILVIACINYMNLATARSVRRSREVGIRKVMGSFRSQLIVQFMAEAFMIAIASTLLSIGLIYLLLPSFNLLANKEIAFSQMFDPKILAGLAGILVFVGLFGGSYPAFYLSRFNPAVALKGRKMPQRGNVGIRKLLVVAQFGISTFMLISTVVVYHQLEFIIRKDLGFDKEQVVRIDIDDAAMRESLEVFRNKITSDPSILHFGTANSTPGENVRKAVVSIEENNGTMAEHSVDYYMADFDFIKTLDMDIVEGRNFSRDFPGDTLHAILVNESMVKRLGWEDPIGKKFQPEGRPARQVVGVIKDYHQNSLYDPIEPLVVVFDKNNYYSFIKFTTGDVMAVVDRIEKAWSEVYPGKPFEFQFLDDSLEAQYDVDERRSTIFMIFSGITIFIACLGLLGLTAFATEQRAKEIGIRKVNGASTMSIIAMITKDFVVLVVIGAMIAFPTAYYFMSEWLMEFAYRIELSDEILTFIWSAFLTVVVTVMTVTYHSIHAALANPIDSLRSE